MRILKVADVDGPSIGIGGVNEFMSRSAEPLRGDGHVVELMFSEDFLPRIRVAGLRRLLVPWALWRKVWRRQRAGTGFDVVEIHEQIAAAYCLMRRTLQRRALPPCVAISYGAREDHWRAQRARWQALGLRGSRKTRVTVPLTLLPQSRYALRSADHLLVPSEHEDAYVGDELGVPEGRRTRIDPGVAEAFFALPRPSANGSGLRIVFVGNWIDRKGTRELVRAWSELANRHPDARLTLSCTVRPPAEVLATFDGHRDRVEIEPTAREGDLVRTLADQDVFVLPAWFEGGMPLATLQGAAAGLACVVTEIGGHVELFRPADPEADGGILVPPSDPAALVAALERLAGEPELVRTLGANARRRAAAFTWRAAADACLAAYERAEAAR